MKTLLPPDWTIPLPSSTCHKPCFSCIFTSFAAFHIWATPCPSWNEGPKTENSTQGIILSEQSTEGQSFLVPANHTISDAGLATISLLGHLSPLLLHVQSVVKQHPQALFCWATFQPVFPKPILLYKIVVTQATWLFALLLFRPASNKGWTNHLLT